MRKFVEKIETLIGVEIYWPVKFRWEAFIRFFYIIGWMIKKPTIINTKHPLASRIKIIDCNGKELLTVQEYNNKTKEAIIMPIIDENGKLIKSTKGIDPIKVSLPNSKMRLILC